MAVKIAIAFTRNRCN